jgi:two-component system CheB/CheR fusion protein
VFLNSDYYNKKGCLLIDEQLPKMNGTNLVSTLRKAACRTPIIMITGEGNIQIAVNTMKAGANDFLEKPFDINALHQKLSHFKSSYNEYLDYDKSKTINADKFKLTKREAEILDQILTGDSNKVIARKIGLSHRTIENHRFSIMKKTKSNSIMDLARNVLIK